MDATQLLKRDHQTVKQLMTAFGATTARAAARRQQLADQIATELEIHATIEEEIFYPAVKALPRGRPLVSEAKSEHKQVERLVAKVQGMDMASDDALARMRQLKKTVLHHATEEEREMFPLARGLGRDRLAELGRELGARKRELKTSALQRAKRAVKKVARKIA